MININIKEIVKRIERVDTFTQLYDIQAAQSEYLDLQFLINEILFKNLEIDKLPSELIKLLVLSASYNQLVNLKHDNARALIFYGDAVKKGACSYSWKCEEWHQDNIKHLNEEQEFKPKVTAQYEYYKNVVNEEIKKLDNLLASKPDIKESEQSRSDRKNSYKKIIKEKGEF